MPSRLKPVLPWTALVVVWIVWGSTFLGIRVAVHDIPPFLMAGSRYVIAGVLMAAIVLATQPQARRISRAELRDVLIAAVLLLVLGNGLLSFSETRLESGTAALVVATVPVWMLLIDAILTRKIRVLSVVGIALGTGGIIALVGTPSAHVPLVPVLLVLFGSLSWAVGSVYARRKSAHSLNPLFPALEMAVAGVLMFVIGAAGGETAQLHVERISAAAFIGFAWLVVFGAMIAYTAYGYAVRTLPTNVVATYAYVNPIVAVALGALVLREALTPNVLLGGAAIVLAVAATLAGNRKSGEQDKRFQETEAVTTGERVA